MLANLTSKTQTVVSTISDDGIPIQFADDLVVDASSGTEQPLCRTAKALATETLAAAAQASCTSQTHPRCSLGVCLIKVEVRTPHAPPVGRAYLLASNSPLLHLRLDFVGHQQD